MHTARRRVRQTKYMALDMGKRIAPITTVSFRSDGCGESFAVLDSLGSLRILLVR